MIEVRRADGELCGHVRRRAGRWQALTVFGAVLSEWDAESRARRDVESNGLAALSDRWMLTDASSQTSQTVCIQQASPAEVTLALDYYSLPGVPTITIGVEELASGRWTLSRDL
jgi:hypothetical protein